MPMICSTNFPSGIFDGSSRSRTDRHDYKGSPLKARDSLPEKRLISGWLSSAAHERTSKGKKITAVPLRVASQSRHTLRFAP